MTEALGMGWYYSERFGLRGALGHDAEFPFGELGRDTLPGERGDDAEADERAFERADIIGVTFDEHIDGILGNVVSIHGGCHTQDCRSGFERWRIEPHHDAGIL